MGKDKKGATPKAPKNREEHVETKAEASSSAGIGGKVGQAKEFYEESLAEMKKVVWPTKQETTATSIAVLVVVVIMSLFLGAVDMLLSRVVQAVLS